MKLAFALLIFFYALYVSWGLLNEGTWDEDCPTRYFNTLIAFKEPGNFVSAWNRPLWVLIFALPVHLGKFVIPVIMAFISGLTAYFLFRTEKMKGISNAFMVIPLLLVQPYFFGVGRDAMTEPLAACTIAAGYFFLQKEQFRNFALVGALLPLARIELSFFLLLWAWILVYRKQWKLVPLLGLGLIAWHLTGMIMDGDPLFLYNEILTRGGENRYGHKPFNTYFARYFYVIGPVVFTFLIAGLIERLLARKVDLFIYGQFVFGFMLYTMFAWKLDIGQSAGFLRNLIPLSPMVAVIALTGMNRWAAAVSGLRKNWIVLIGIPLAVLFTGLFFRNKIAIHHIVKEEFDPYNITIAGGLLALLILGWVLTKTKILASRTVEIGLISLVVLITTAHTLITEPPDANMNEERKTMSRVARMHKATGLNKAPETLCNYYWFHWVAGYSRDSDRFKRLNKANMEAAPPGSIVIWEPHFSNRLSADVPIEYLQQNQDYHQLALFTAGDFSRNMFVYRKKVPGENLEATINTWIERAGEWPEALVTRGSQLMNRGDLVAAEKIFRQSLEVDSMHTITLNMLAQVQIKNNNHTEAEETIRKAIRSGENYPVNHYILGNIQYSTGKYNESLESYARAIELNEKVSSFYYNRGLAYAQLRNNSAACADFTKAKELGYANADAMISQYCAQQTQNQLGATN